jgi:hypothetical protein
MKIEVVLGDITQQDVEAVMWLLHTGGRDYSGMADKALQRVEPRFHEGLIQSHAGGLFRQNKDTALIEIEGSPTGYDKVLFVGDDIWDGEPLPLFDIVTAGLVRAEQSGITSLALIPFRTGKAAWMFDSDVQEAELIRALKEFDSTVLQTARVVVYGDEEQVQRLSALTR